MINLKTLVLLVLISFSLQDKNCLVYFGGCSKNKQTYKIQIENCKEGYVDEVDLNDYYCTECENGYFLSKRNSSCIHIDNPIDNCLYYSEYVDNVCEQCEKDYAVSNGGKSCKKVENPIEHCIQYSFYSETDKCKECEMVLYFLLFKMYA